MLDVLGFLPRLAGVAISGVLVCDVGGTAGGSSAWNVKSASPGRKDAGGSGRDDMLGSCEPHVFMVRTLLRIECSTFLFHCWIACLMLRQYGPIHQRYCVHRLRSHDRL
jgi:hypothetical protein